MSHNEEWSEDTQQSASSAKTNTSESSKSGSNGANDADVREAFQEILSHYEELGSEHAAYMNRARQIRARMAETYDQAADRGITRKILKAKVKEYRLEQKIAAIRETLSEDDQREFDQLAEALGEFSQLPLGQAALAAAKQRDDDRFADA
jgi:hypothetical protein